MYGIFSLIFNIHYFILIILLCFADKYFIGTYFILCTAYIIFLHFYDIDAFDVIQQKYGIVQEKLVDYFRHKYETAIPDEMSELMEGEIPANPEIPLEILLPAVPEPEVPAEPEVTEVLETDEDQDNALYRAALMVKIKIISYTSFSTLLCGFVLYQMKRIICF